MIIIAITGTIGSGKGTISDYLVKNKKFIHLSVRDYLTTILNSENKPLNRENMYNLANKLREENGAGFIIEELYKQAKKINKNTVIESIRAEKEVEVLKNKKNTFLIATDANIKERYQRILKRKATTDHITFEEFKEDEKKEFSTKDKNKQNLKVCIQLSDFKVENDSSFNILYKKIDIILEQINKKTKI